MLERFNFLDPLASRNVGADVKPSGVSSRVAWLPVLASRSGTTTQ